MIQFRRKVGCPQSAIVETACYCIDGNSERRLTPHAVAPHGRITGHKTQIKTDVRKDLAQISVCCLNVLWMEEWRIARGHIDAGLGQGSSTRSEEWKIEQRYRRPDGVSRVDDD